MDGPRWKEQIRALVEEVHAVHKEHQAIWTRTYESTKGHAATSLAYKAAQPQAERLRALLEELFWNTLQPVEERMLAGDAVAIDQIIDFLAVDLPAFHCGYAKEWYLRKLKSLPLRIDQQERLRGLALEQCRTLTYRREFREWCRLMIRLADKGFVEALLPLTESVHGFIWLKSNLMLYKVLNNRPELRQYTAGRPFSRFEWHPYPKWKV